MVDLPTIANGVPSVHAPQTRVSPGQIAQPYNELAANLDKAGETLSKTVAEPLAKQAGLKAVTRDSAGNVVIDRPPIVGDAAIEYSRAAKVAAVADGETEAKLRNIDMREQHRDDPEGYLKAAAVYNQEIQKTFKAAGTEVQFALGKQVDHLAVETYNGLLNEKRRKDVTRFTQSITTQIQATQNDMFAMANGGDTASPEFLAAGNKIKMLYGELVNNPLIAYSKDRANFEMAQWDSTMRANGIAFRIAGEVYNQQGPQAALTAAEGIRTDRSLNLSPQQRESYFSHTVAAIQKRMVNEDKNDRALSVEIGDINKITTDGDRPTDTRMATLKQAVAGSRNQHVINEYETMVANLPVVADWKQLNPAQLQTQLGSLEKYMRENGTDDRTRALRKSGYALLETMNKEIARDPIGWAETAGIVTAPMINFGAPTAGDEMRGRVAIAESIANKYSIPPQYLRPEEQRFLETATAAGGNAMLGTAKNIVDGFGDRSGRVLGEISKQAPVLAHMGGLLSGGLFGGGSVTFANDVAEGVALRSNKEAEKLLPHWVTKPSDKIYQFEITRKVDQYGAAFLMVPDNGRAAEQSAKSAFMVRAMRNGYDPQSIDVGGSVSSAYNRALQEAAGATYTSDDTRYGGVNVWSKTGIIGFRTPHHVLVPGNIRADRFNDVIGAIKDEDLRLMPISPQAAGGQPYTARDLRDATPVAVPGGYRFSHGDPSSSDPKWLRGADGQPFVLNLDRMEPELRLRVPGAYLGGR